MKLVILESPYAGDIKNNTKYAIRAMRDSISRGEAPFASHLVYPYILDENIPEERKKGIELGFAWWLMADLIAFYCDLGMSPGMQASMNRIAQKRTEERLAIIDGGYRGSCWAVPNFELRYIDQ